MAKITGLATTKNLTDDDQFVVETSSGTRKIATKDMVDSFMGMYISPDSKVIGMTAINHRNRYRGKNLGTTFTIAQKNAIKDGTFDDLYVGDYWVDEYSKIQWYIVDIDLFFDPSYPKHHLVVMPGGGLYMTDNKNLNQQGYVGSIVHKNIGTADGKFQHFFNDYLMTHTEQLTNTMRGPITVGSANYQVKSVIPSLVNVYGNTAMFPITNRADNSFVIGALPVQFKIFWFNPSFITKGGNTILRDVTWEDSLVYTDMHGYPHWTNNTDIYSVMPYALIGA